MGDTGEAFSAFREMKQEERRKKEPMRFKYVEGFLKEFEMNYVVYDEKMVIDTGKGSIEFWPYTGWFCGRRPLGKIKGRGVSLLVAQLKKLKEHVCFYGGMDFSEEGSPKVVCSCGKKKVMPILDTSGLGGV